MRVQQRAECFPDEYMWHRGVNDARNVELYGTRSAALPSLLQPCPGRIIPSTDNRHPSPLAKPASLGHTPHDLSPRHLRMGANASTLPAYIIQVKVN